MTRIADIGLLYAGGAGRRLGGVDKGAIMVGGERLADIAIKKLNQISNKTVVTAPEPPNWLHQNECLAFSADLMDDAGDPIGPAGGLLSGLIWARAYNASSSIVATMPLDAPFTPLSLYSDLADALGDADVAWPRFNGRAQPVLALWKVQCIAHIERMIYDENRRSLSELSEGLHVKCIDLEIPKPATLNINTPEDLEYAHQHVDVETVATAKAGAQ